MFDIRCLKTSNLPKEFLLAIKVKFKGNKEPFQRCLGVFFLYQMTVMLLLQILCTNIFVFILHPLLRTVHRSIIYKLSNIQI